MLPALSDKEIKKEGCSHEGSNYADRKFGGCYNYSGQHICQIQYNSAQQSRTYNEKSIITSS